MEMDNKIKGFRDRLIHYFSHRIDNLWDAQELAQDVFVKILHSGKTFTDYPLPHLYTVASSVLNDKLRRWEVRQHHNHCEYIDTNVDEKPQPFVDDILTPEECTIMEEKYHHVITAVYALSEAQRITFLLNRYEGMTYREIAEHRGVSVSSVEKCMIAALKIFKQVFDSNNSSNAIDYLR
jgi:RNA polymerase sigma factor (sigma-70 family)